MKQSLYEIVKVQSFNENDLILANMDKVASKAGITHRAVNNLINKYKNRLKESGPVKFKIASDNTHKKTYKLDAPQCAFIVERMHTKNAMNLQSQIANVFTDQSRKQIERQAVHQVSKNAVKSLSDAIKDNLDSPAGYVYKNFTNLAYKYALGVGVTKMQHIRGAKGTSNKKDYLFPHEIELLSKAMTTIEALLNVGMTYDDIRDHLNGKCLSKAKITFKLKHSVNS